MMPTEVDLLRSIVAQLADDDGGLYVSAYEARDGTVHVTLDGGIILTPAEAALWRSLTTPPIEQDR
jgi:hypothetical protein